MVVTAIDPSPDSSEKTPSEAIIERVAELEDKDALELTPPLYEAIDPEALDSLCKSPADEHSHRAKVSFTHWGYRITVLTDGEISITPT